MRSKRQIGAALLAAVTALLLGYLVYFVIEHALTAIWVDVPAMFGDSPLWFAPAVLIPSAALVYLIRRHLGDYGHSPLAGITLSSLSPREYGPVIATIAVSLIGGAVLGPEVALVSTGSVVGYVVGRWLKAPDQRKIVAAGAGGAILALIVGPLLSGSFALSDRPDGIQVEDLAWAVPVALVVAIIVALARAIGIAISRIAGGGPHLGALLAAAVLIAVGAMGFQAITGQSFALIPTSGAEYLDDLSSITVAGTLLLLVVIKALAYAVSLGAGFAGGPFFPAMFIGAAGGVWGAMVLPVAPHPTAAAAVGVTAATIMTARMPWVAVIGLSVLVGFAVGGWIAIAPALLGGVTAALIGRGFSRWIHADQRNGGNDEAETTNVR